MKKEVNIVEYGSPFLPGSEEFKNIKFLSDISKQSCV